MAGRRRPRPASARPQQAAGHRTRPRPRVAGRAGRACDCSSATRSPTGRRRWPRHTPDTSSAATFPAWATAGRCCWANSRRPAAVFATSTSRARGPRRSPGAATASPRSARCCASTSSAKRCTRWASRPPGRWPWWRRGAPCTARRHCRAPCSPASRAAICGSAPSSTRRPPVTSPCCGGWPITPSPGTTRTRRDAENPYLALFEAVAARQAALVAQWMLVGFVHGVMNTDNMTISGETIDYGPCAFMDTYDPETVFSSIDSWGRYAYGNQPSIAGVEPRPVRRGAASTARRRPGAGRRPRAGEPGRLRPAVPDRAGDRHAVQARSVREGRRRGGDAADERSARAACGEPRRLHLLLPEPRPGRPRRRRTGPRACSSTSRGSTNGWHGGVL